MREENQVNTQDGMGSQSNDGILTNNAAPVSAEGASQTTNNVAEPQAAAETPASETQPRISALDVFYIGTVVRLEGAERDVMIIGYGGKDVSGGVHDYIGVPHPFGLASANALMAFDAKQIVGVQFFGYGNTPAQEYVAKIVHACETGELSLPMLSAD